MQDASALAFVIAALVLLAAPGPTNALLAASGAASGFVRSLRLAPAAISGYLTAIVLLVTALAGVVAAHPWLALVLKLAASLWLAWCAVGLWRQAGAAPRLDGALVSLRRMFLTTLTNPKALVFALVIFPQRSLPELFPWLAGFAGLAALVCVGWIALGAALARAAGTLATPRRICLAASVMLAAFAAALAGSAVSAGS